MENQLSIQCEGSTTINLDDLSDLQGNLKDLEEDEYAKLRQSITEFGFSFPILFWQDESGKKWIIDAHQRRRTLLKMREEGWFIPPLPASQIFAISKTQAKEKLLLLNSRYGKITQEGWDEFTGDIPMDEINDLLEIPEMEMNYDNHAPDVTEDEAPEVDEQNPPVSQLGEVYQLGRHRLMCGDATKIEDVEKLMNGQKAEMVFTDPPYNIDYKSGTWSEERKAQMREIANDNMSEKDFVNFLSTSLTINKTICPEGDQYICTDWKVFHLFREAIIKSGQVLKNVIIWNKLFQTQALNTFANAHEMILFIGDNGGPYKDINVWDCKREFAPDHPTPKPIELIAKAINYSSKNSDLVVDLFGGSGSTLIACEQTNRTCYMMELDPRYCDVIRKRYAKFIGHEDTWQETAPTVI